jgi:hypothetical protein
MRAVVYKDPGSVLYHYYVCRAFRRKFTGGSPHRLPYVNGEWLEELVWADVRHFLENPGEVLERVREQARLASGDNAEDPEKRRAELEKRIASKSVEKDRYARAFAQGHISEDET